MIDAELVTRKMVLILRDLSEVRPIARKGLAEYLASEFDEVLAERYLERMIGRMIDIDYHLITETARPPPPDYYQSFTQLGALGVLDPEVAGRMTVYAGLRNRIAHEYDELDPRKVHGALQAAMRDIPDYLRQVKDYVEGVRPVNL